jgi:hypothetical protein
VVPVVADGDEVMPDAAFPYVPALHVQLLADELALGELELAGHARHVVAFVAPVAVEYVPAAQSVHAALPIAVLYFPDTQAAHGPPSGPVNPALQPADTHAVTLELPTAELVPAGHATQPVAAHSVPVRSTPFTIALAIAVVASGMRNSSTAKRPAMSPLKKYSVVEKMLLPMNVEDTVLSVTPVVPVLVVVTPFTVNETTLVDVR